MKRRTPPKRKPATPPPAPAGVPASEDIEAAALGCVWLAAEDGSQGQVDALLGQLSGRMFDNPRNRLAFETAQAIRAGGNHLDAVVWRSWCKARPEWNGMDPDTVWSFKDQTPSAWNFKTYLGSLQEAATRRFLRAKAVELGGLADGPDVSLDTVRGRLAELLDNTSRAGRVKGPTLSFVKLSEHIGYRPAEDLCLIGDNDIQKGYQGITVIAGPPGSGKSLAAGSLAVAGALGRGLWMGRPVHRPFRTLIVQCENGGRRLQREFAAMQEAYPDVDFDAWIRVSLPPEGGLPFHRAEFRRDLARAVEEFKPDVVIVDPWTAVAAEDAAKDIVEKLAEMRSCLPPGDSCPALVIVAHTKKPRAEDKGNRGRALMYSVSGSQALVATARSVFVLLPFTDDIQDDQVLWACAKLSDSENPPADSVWHRRLGRLFQPSTANPEDYWKDADARPAQWLTVDMLRDVLTKPAPATMTQNRLADSLAERFNGGRGASSVHKWLKRPEYAEHLSVQSGLISWKD